SRSRHTRFSRDWSSDVCSSDLYRFYTQGSAFHWKTHFTPGEMAAYYTSDKELSALTSHRIGLEASRAFALDELGSKLNAVLLLEIGRASCRERVDETVANGAGR